MNEQSYESLLNEQVGYTPGLILSPEQVQKLNPALMRDPERPHVLPFAGLILPSHEALFSTTDSVHSFLGRHYTPKLRKLTANRPLYVRACPVAGWTVLEQLSRKGLIVDAPVHLRIRRLVAEFPVALRDSRKPHPVFSGWYFYSILPGNRHMIVEHLEKRYQSNEATSDPPEKEKIPSPSARQWPNGF